MQTSWISSSTTLPRDGEPVRFLADGREVGLRGTYTSGVFHSRWAEYEVGRIGAWRALDINPAGVMPAPSDRARTEASLLKRLRALMARHRFVAAEAEMVEAARIGAGAGSIAAPARRAPAFRSCASDSNQMSC